MSERYVELHARHSTIVHFGVNGNPQRGSVQDRRYCGRIASWHSVLRFPRSAAGAECGLQSELPGDVFLPGVLAGGATACDRGADRVLLLFRQRPIDARDPVRQPRNRPGAQHRLLLVFGGMLPAPQAAPITRDCSSARPRRGQPASGELGCAPRTAAPWTDGRPLRPGMTCRFAGTNGQYRQIGDSEAIA